MRISAEALGRFGEWAVQKRLHEWAVLLLLVFVLLFRGGKSLESTWLLTGVAGIVTLFTWWRIRMKRMIVRTIPRAVWIPAVLFVLWTMISFVLSTTKNYGLDEVLRDTSLVLLFFWAARLPEDGEQSMTFHDRFFYLLLVIAIGACVLGFAVYILQPVNRFVGPFFDHRFHTDYWPNAWAQFLLLAWPVFYWFLFQTKNHRAYLLRLLLLGFVVGCLFLSYSRGAVLAFVGQVIILFLLTRFVSGTSSKNPPAISSGNPLLRFVGDLQWRKIFFASGIILIVSLCTFGFVNSVRQQFYPVASVTEKVTFTSDEGGSSVSERSQFFAQAIRLTLKKPLFGFGPYSFRFVQPSMQKNVLATSDHPHNIFLKYAAERGIPAALFFLALLFFIAKPLVLKARRKTLTPVAIILSISVLGVLAHNLIDFNVQFVGIALPFWLMLGLLVRSSSGTPEMPRKMVLGTEVLLACVLLILTVSEGRYLILSSLGRHAEIQGDRERALAWYERSRGEIFSRDMHLSRTQLLSAAGNFPAAQDALDSYLTMNQEDARGWKLQGDLALKHRDLSLAERSYEQAYSVSKYNDLSTMYGLLDALNQSGNSQAIGARKAEIDQLLLAYATAIVENTHFIALGHNVEAFIAVTDTLGELYPDEAPKYQILAARIDRHAKEERAKLEARPPGYLW